ncbi:MAG: porin family protein [Bacteroidales bacterium]|nr:porin family protein [Bacteroidales bacterium]
MKRIALAIALIALSISASAQTKAQYTNEYKGWYVGVHGGINYSGNENAKYGNFAELLTGTALVSVGYKLDDIWGVRAMGGYGTNVSATNVKESHAPIDYYTLKDATGFVDATLDLSYLMTKRNDCAVDLKAFLGIGAGIAWDYGESEVLPWYHITKTTQFAIALRAGLSAEYRINNRIGATVDAALAGFQDNFNGVSAGIFYDLRGTLAFGVVYHF